MALLENQSNRSLTPKQDCFETCYVCGRRINTAQDFGFSSTIRHGGERKYFHLDHAQEGDPITYTEVEAEFAKYQH